MKDEGRCGLRQDKKRVGLVHGPEFHCAKGCQWVLPPGSLMTSWKREGEQKYTSDHSLKGKVGKIQ